MSKASKQVASFHPEEEEEEEEDDMMAAFEELPSTIKRRVLALKKIHGEHHALEKKYREEVMVLERKYQDLYAPLFLKRASIVNGEHEPSDEESRVEDQEPIKVDPKDKDIKGIPEFWLTVMRNNPAVGPKVTDADEEALKHLKDVRYTRLDGDKPGFRLSFYFAENPYFTDSVLTKTYHLVDDDNLFGELVFDHAEGCTIKWKPNKNLTVKVVKKQAKKPARGGKKGGAGGAGRVQTIETPCDSFFNFFAAPVPPKDLDEEDEENYLDDMLEEDFETGVIFKDKLIPHAALWFTGEALAYEDDFGDDYGFDEEGFGDEDDDEDDDDEDDDEEEEEEDEKPRKGGRGGAQPPKKGGGGPARGQLPPPTQKPGGPGQPQQPECKQQ